MQQDSLLDDEKIESSKGPVECLGQTFENEEARREHFTEILREKLKDPEFRNIEGFPIGSDEAILELSDPPYYTACPNPWLNDFVEYWESKKETSEEEYHREPFATDVSEGKSDLIYTAHSYHTKVPYKAIVRYILHYTNPGDIVFDSFCGTGMTGVAAQMCGDKKVIESLGYLVKRDGSIYEEISNINGDKNWRKLSAIGVRKCVLNDLSPIASFIASNYNRPVEESAFNNEINQILEKVEDECGWMYETMHSDGSRAKINYTVWSDVFICNDCTGEVVFSFAAVEQQTGKVADVFPCPHCNAELSKRKMERAFERVYDNNLNKTINRAKQVPVKINYSVEGIKKPFDKVPDELDLSLNEKIESNEVPYWFPASRLMVGKETRRNEKIGITHVHHFYRKRALNTLGLAYSLIEKCSPEIKNYIRFTIEQAVLGFAKISRYVPSHFSQVNQYLSGTLYVGSQVVDVSLPYILNGKIKRLTSTLKQFTQKSEFALQTGDASRVDIKENSLDYIFIDPPFGANLSYSELNFLWESWLGVSTNIGPEAIENSSHNKGLSQYRLLMSACFKEAYKALKPGRWMTVEFSNTKASVWNSIQSAISESGFIVANVSALDKKQGSFKAVTTTTAVKQDLVISAYKPDKEFEQRFTDESHSVKGVWDFISTHLHYLPVVKLQDNLLVRIPERDPRILFDQVVAYFIRKSIPVPLSSQEFQKGLIESFSERDGMFFLPEQVVEYDRKRAKLGTVQQLVIFVDDEASAIEWLRQELKSKPKTYSDIHPLFLNELSGWKKNELQLELMTLLEQNFIKYDGKEDVPNQIHTYLSTNFKDMRGLAKDDPALVAKAKDRWYVPDPGKAGDIEKLRLRALLREFDAYKEEKKKIKQPRAEALRAGFNACWEKQDLQTILDISAKIPAAVLQEDEKLLMFYDNALTLTSNDDDDWD
jgi:DNA modification methylase